jgi:hypothetical protein
MVAYFPAFGDYAKHSEWKGVEEGGGGSNYPPLFPGEIQSNKSSDRWHKDFGIIRTSNIFKEIGKNANSYVNLISVKVSYC